MAKRKSAIDRLAEAIQELGLDKAEAAFRLLRSYNTAPAPKKERKPKAVGATT